MKKRIVIPTIVIASLSLLVAPLSQVIITFVCPAQFDETYYGELNPMYQRLTSTTKKKIVLVGNSNIAFGVDQQLLQDELYAAGYDYEVVNFGLYGSIGTKVMMELSQNYINKDDIVLFIPEFGQQPMSLYFSAKEMLYTLDGDFTMMKELEEQEQKEIQGAIIDFNGEKFKYILEGKKPSSGDIYKKAAFDSKGTLNQIKRDNNQMTYYYDPNNGVYFDSSLFGDGFIDYVNSYYEKILAKGAKMYYSYTPVNKLALRSNDEEIETFNKYIYDNFEFKPISNPHDYILEANWFFDSNFHLNTNGMKLRTLQLAEDLLNEFGSNQPLKNSQPEMPALLDNDEDDPNADDSFVGDFTYTEESNSYRISGLTEEGKQKKNIVIPYHYNGKKIVSFDAITFQDDTNIESITLQSNISILKDYAFQGCTNLKEIKLEQTNPEKITIGLNLLTGCNAKLLVKKDYLSAFLSNYFWGHYSEHYETY